jgi:hypothetical protein
LKTGSVFWKGNLKYQVLSVKKGKRTIRVIGNRWKKKSLSVPKQVTYQSITFRVTEIGAKAFYQSKYITKVTIPNSVTALGSKAFAKMKSLKAVTIGTGGKQIGKQAFQKSEKLAKIVIKSKKISKIGAKAFASISAKAKIYVPKQKKNTYQKLLKASKCKKSIFLIS